MRGRVLAVALLFAEGASIVGPAGRYAFDVPRPVRITQAADRVVLDWSDGGVAPAPEPAPGPAPGPLPQRDRTELEKAAADYVAAFADALDRAAQDVEDVNINTHADVLTAFASYRDPARLAFGKTLNEATRPTLTPDGRFADRATYARLIREAARGMRSGR